MFISLNKINKYEDVTGLRIILNKDKLEEVLEFTPSYKYLKIKIINYIGKSNVAVYINNLEKEEGCLTLSSKNMLRLDDFTVDKVKFKLLPVLEEINETNIEIILMR